MSQSDSNEARQIEALCRRRGVTRVMHFTRACNLPRILKRGLLTRKELERVARDDPGYQVAFNDTGRNDGQRSSISTSIEFPNHSLFTKFRNLYPLWAVLELEESILWEMPCSFCPTNAASGSLKGKHAELMGVAALEALFNGGPRDRLAKAMATDVQAEVLVYGAIPPDKIRAAYFRTREDLERALEFCDGLIRAQRFEVGPQWFSSRDFHLERASTAQPSGWIACIRRWIAKLWEKRA